VARGVIRVSEVVAREEERATVGRFARDDVAPLNVDDVVVPAVP
jgi:hypothetical protein